MVTVVRRSGFNNSNILLCSQEELLAVEGKVGMWHDSDGTRGPGGEDFIVDAPLDCDLMVVYSGRRTW